HHQVHIEVPGAGDRPGDRFGDVVGGQRLADALVHRGGLVGVAAEPVHRELVRTDHPRRDLDDPYRLAGQLEPEGARHRVLGVLGGRVPTAALVGDAAGGGGQHHGGAVAAGDQV